MKRRIIILAVGLTLAGVSGLPQAREQAPDAPQPRKQHGRQSHKPPALEVYWREQGDEVVLSSVCENHRYGSLPYRDCRSRAAQVFETRCHDYGARTDASSGETRARNQRQRDMYCRAASQFTIVN